MSLRETFQKFFEPTKPERQKRADAVEWARGYLLLCEQPAFVDVVRRIRAAADKDINTSGDLSAAIGRSNGIKEILRMLDSDKQRAQRILSTVERG